MRSKKPSVGLRATLAIIPLILFITCTSAATEKKLHNFGKGTDGIYPSGLIFDASGNLYGTTRNGGDYGYGTVFELALKQGGGWTEKKLHSFQIPIYHSEGSSPDAGVVFDAAGNLYGTTGSGGQYL
ncbi:MAG: choice-of-anchor tandem repeat GloVer-containing protein, partial [Candidatus Korobacteraceae bacterium]